MFPANVLPIGIQSFENIINNQAIYIDKTEQIYHLIKNGRNYFFSRPRRFGKSLLVSTLKAIFEGKKELFDGLWISSSDYLWKSYPVFHLDMTMPSNKTIDSLKQKIVFSVQLAAEKYAISIDKTRDLDIQLKEFIIKAKNKYDNVVILIDEYDHPIHSNIDDKTKMNEIRSFLSLFYSNFKELGEYIHFCFLTGITQFSKVSIFSGLNNLNDISLNKNFATLLGYTQDEIESSFSTRLDRIAQNKGITKNVLLEEMKCWYNGYRFSHYSLNKVYNPFSILVFLENEGDFQNYWYKSGNTSFFYQYLKNQLSEIKAIENTTLSVTSIGANEPEYPDLRSLMFQTGYLTISDFDAISNQLILNFPNHEVRHSFYLTTLHLETNKDMRIFEKAAVKAAQALESCHINDFISSVYEVFLQIPYSLHIKDKESYYHVILYIFVAMLGKDIKYGAEELTNLGRLDLFIESKDYIYICEMKVNKSPKEALRQILERRYYEKFLGKGKKVVLLGLAFDESVRNISEWESETL